MRVMNRDAGIAASSPSAFVIFVCSDKDLGWCRISITFDALVIWTASVSPSPASVAGLVAGVFWGATLEGVMLLPFSCEVRASDMGNPRAASLSRRTISSTLLRRRLAAAFVPASFVSGVEDMEERGEKGGGKSFLSFFVMCVGRGTGDAISSFLSDLSFFSVPGRLRSYVLEDICCNIS